MCWWGVTHKLTHLAMWVHKRPGDTWTYICVHKLWRVPKQDDILIGLGVCLHIHEKKTIYGLMNAHRRGFWIGVDTAKLTGHQCNFVTGTHTHPHQCTHKALNFTWKSTLKQNTYHFRTLRLELIMTHRAFKGMVPQCLITLWAHKCFVLDIPSHWV